MLSIKHKNTGKHPLSHCTILIDYSEFLFDIKLEFTGKIIESNRIRSLRIKDSICLLATLADKPKDMATIKRQRC